MNKILAILGVTLLAFILGFIGIYFAMPFLAPETFEKTEAMIDSLRYQETLASIEDSSLAAFHNSPLGLVTDSLYASIAAVEETVTRQLGQQHEQIASLQDSLRSAYAAMAALKQQRQALLGQFQDLDQRLKKLEAQRIEVRDLSATLPKLEDGELSAILQQLDLNLLEMLFAESTSRNRSRILKALTAEQAARFVAHLVKGPNRDLLPEQNPAETTSPPSDQPVSMSNTNEKA